jgi:hypothetical protein
MSTVATASMSRGAAAARAAGPGRDERGEDVERGDLGLAQLLSEVERHGTVEGPKSQRDHEDAGRREQEARRPERGRSEPNLAVFFGSADRQERQREPRDEHEMEEERAR